MPKERRGKVSSVAAGAAAVSPSPTKRKRAERAIPVRGPARATSASAVRFGGKEASGAWVPK